MAVLINIAKNSATMTNVGKNSASLTNSSKSIYYSKLQLENGDFFLLENGDYFLLEIPSTTSATLTNIAKN